MLVTKVAADAFKTAWEKKTILKTAPATGDLIGNKIVNNVTGTVSWSAMDTY